MSTVPTRCGLPLSWSRKERNSESELVARKVGVSSANAESGNTKNIINITLIRFFIFKLLTNL